MFPDKVKLMGIPQKERTRNDKEMESNLTNIEQRSDMPRQPKLPGDFAIVEFDDSGRMGKYELVLA